MNILFIKVCDNMEFEAYNISLIPIIIFLCEIAIKLGLSKKLTPLVCLVLGVIAGVFYLSPDDIFKGILSGILLASSAVGFYSGTKNVSQSFINKRKEN